MIDIKLREEEKELIVPIDKIDEINKKLNPDAYYLKEISETLKDILKELKGRTK